MLDKSKKEKKRNDVETLVNEKINYNQIRLIDVSGSQLGIYSSKDAMNMALNAGLDLVLISEKSNPPVCRIIDYGKYKFIQEKKAKEAKKKQHNVTIKEVKMRYKIDVHDYNVRINQALRFLQSGDKVKANVIFRGREIQHAQLAIELLNKMAKDLSKISEIQQPPSKDGRNVIMILSPKKIL
uniref:Translation initiation factor IF-3 n=1 Tax=Gracilaria edulis TaxID=172966 RepID=A0A6C0A9M3_9FLOR|nr:translation initiation factor 3 [Gracilaria edulis]QHS70530.1 translation initiation factor 3 [Gracilaria edulis]UAD85561.1 translation initiation factor 3 [Gracilaria edulis]